MPNELNPNHPVTSRMRGEWHKLCGLALFILGEREVEITSEDLDRMERAFPNGPCVVADCRGGRLVVRLLDMKEGERLAREEGGLPA